MRGSWSEWYKQRFHWIGKVIFCFCSKGGLQWSALLGINCFSLFACSYNALWELPLICFTLLYIYWSPFQHFPSNYAAELQNVKPTNRSLYELFARLPPLKVRNSLKISKILSPPARKAETSKIKGKNYRHRVRKALHDYTAVATAIRAHRSKLQLSRENLAKPFDFQPRATKHQARNSRALETFSEFHDRVYAYAYIYIYVQRVLCTYIIYIYATSLWRAARNYHRVIERGGGEHKRF